MKIVKTQKKLITNFNSGYYGLLVQEIDERWEVSSKNLPPSTKIAADLQKVDSWKRYVVNYNPKYFMDSITDEDAEKLMELLSARLGGKKLVEILIKTHQQNTEEFHGTF